jgi:hypothetical protein
MRVTVGKFGDEQIIPDQKRGNHRTGRDVERLKEEGADHKRNDQSMKNNAHCLGKATFFPFGSGLHTHQLSSRQEAPAARRGLVASGAATRNYAWDLVAGFVKSILCSAAKHL